MYLIVGLGNPEEEYSNTRHNMGFCTINEISKKFNILVTKNKFNSLYGQGLINGEKVILVKPQTYMNLSGEAVKEFVDFYKVDLTNIILIYDDMDVEKGKIKVRKQGSSGSHNGVKSVVEYLNSEKIPRIRIGIGKPENKKLMIEYVIGKISKQEQEELNEGIKKAAEAVEIIINNNLDTAMNAYNNK